MEENRSNLSATNLVLGGLGEKDENEQEGKKGSKYELSSRDLDLLHYLCFGPSTIKSISRRFFHRKDEKEARRDGSNIVLNPSVYSYRRIRRLSKQKYILLSDFEWKGSRIVSLRLRGAEEVVMEFGEEIENIKYAPPKEAEVPHDIMVASSLRKLILNEACTGKLDQVNWYKTEQFLRRNSGRTTEKSKGSFFPDFVISLYSKKSNQSEIVNFEIDGGSMRRSVVYGKLTSFRCNAIVIGKTPVRLKTLFDYVKEDANNPAMVAKGRLPKTMLFVLWEDLLRNGCNNATFWSCPSGDEVKFPFV